MNELITDEVRESWVNDIDKRRAVGCLSDEKETNELLVALGQEGFKEQARIHHDVSGVKIPVTTWIRWDGDLILLCKMKEKPLLSVIFYKNRATMDDFIKMMKILSLDLTQAKSELKKLWGGSGALPWWSAGRFKGSDIGIGWILCALHQLKRNRYDIRRSVRDRKAVGWVSRTVERSV